MGNAARLPLKAARVLTARIPATQPLTGWALVKDLAARTDAFPATTRRYTGSVLSAVTARAGPDLITRIRHHLPTGRALPFKVAVGGPPDSSGRTVRRHRTASRRRGRPDGAMSRPGTSAWDAKFRVTGSPGNAATAAPLEGARSARHVPRAERFGPRSSPAARGAGHDGERLPYGDRTPRTGPGVSGVTVRSSGSVRGRPEAVPPHVPVPLVDHIAQREATDAAGQVVEEQPGEVVAPSGDLTGRVRGDDHAGHVPQR